MAAVNKALQICSGCPNVLPASILDPNPPWAPTGSSPTIVPTTDAAIPSLKDVKRNGMDFGNLSRSKI